MYPRFLVRTLEFLAALLLLTNTAGEVLNPPYFNLAEGRHVEASATCGVGVYEPELYCKLVGANTDRVNIDNPNILIQGQVCDYCDPSDPKRSHPAENAVDGTERWWQSPPLSRSNKYNEVNLTIYLGQEFHVAYVFIKMGNSPRPGVWILERSTDNGDTYSPWQYFADTPGDCVRYFGPDSLQPLTKDNSVVCETKFSKVVPLEGGEIVVSLLNDRPNADNFSYSTVLQEFTKATNIRLRFLRTKTLLGHLMSVARQDPTVTRRYFYSIKDINIGGRCVCNGHAETCDLTDPFDPYKLLCRCQHNTCGPQCEKCCPGFQQKAWRRAIIDSPFICEPCNCFGHSDECIYDNKIDDQRLSLDIHGHYEGGGVCKNCHHNTQGINCNQCKPTFYRPYGKLLNATDVCQPCNCDPTYSTGNCADGNGQCECRPEYRPPYCDSCSDGYYGYPSCRPCDCHTNGTEGNVCEVGGGQCPCKYNYAGKNCELCQQGFYGFPECLPCDCHLDTSVSDICDGADGQCACRGNYGGRQCNKCRAGYYNYPLCEYCDCDPTGCIQEICDSNTGSCLCKVGYGGSQCDRCAPGYFGYPNCRECNCDEQGSLSSVCDNTGRCRCLPNYSGVKCDQCSPGFFGFPYCLSCDCSLDGAIGISCDNEGICTCRDNFDGNKCDGCREGFYNYPLCEECNCNPAGVLATFVGCGSLTSGELCECKERVTGRICNKCKSLYWNLKVGNPLGCEDCNCFLDGTVGGIAVCDSINGQCMCKPNVGSRQCSECEDGSYQLDRDDIFGCKDCGCDVGGSVNNVCDKRTGQCACRPRINGRRCDKPIQTHYFPTLFQHQFEIEDGRTPVGTQVRYGYEESVFPEFSWRGYAVFSDIQKEVLLDIFVGKPSLYQVFFRYLNFGGEKVFGTITFTPETFGDIQQSSDMVFETTMQPKFMRVSGKQSLIASPFVLNPGRWIVSIRIEKPLFLDYMVLLPQAYYEATLIQEVVNSPCGLNGANHEQMCQKYRYPSLPTEAVVVRGEAGYVADGDERINTNIYSEEDVLEELQSGKMAWLDKDQHSLHLDFTVSRSGPYIVLITYHTPDGGQSTSGMVEVSTSSRMYKGKALFYDCTFSFHCRAIVIDHNGEVAIFELDDNFVSLVLETEEDSSIAVDNVALVPADLWHTDYIVPKALCIHQGNSCIDSVFFPIPEATKIEFESGTNEERIATSLPENIYDSLAGLVQLNDDDPVVDLHGSVPIAGYYTFVIHYYQPDHSEFRAHVIIQNGQFYEAAVPLSFCPSASGCRSIIQATETNSTSFQILENYVITVKQPGDKSAWLDYLLTIPADQFHETYLHPLPEDNAGKFITECGQNSFYLSSKAEGFCKEATFSLTSEYNNGALPCQCDTDGSLSYECDEFGGQCPCKPNVIGRSCSQCKTGYFGFPNCKPCDCPSTAVCHPLTGQCICPPRVMGDRCDTCVPYTYGFDSIIGCEECNCNQLGVYQGILQCDLNTGSCRCKANVVGRTCDKCKSGYWAFPYCQLCNCDLRGSTEDICEQESARCFCKENVYGASCDQCKPGTFYLEETNPIGCTKCFCFGTTDRCSSAFLFNFQMSDMHFWDTVGLKLDNDLSFVDINVTLVEAGNILQAVLPTRLPAGSLFFFSSPKSYLGNKLSSYGGTLSYTILSVVDREAAVGSLIGPDLVLTGNNITIVHDHIEQPAGDLPLDVKINLLEREFHHVSGREVTREQMMMVLVNLEHLLIRGSYFHPSIEIRLSNMQMSVATDEYTADSNQALRVEQCQCPPGYIGNSCERCAPGHFRAKTGPYLGYCVPCQCHGHAHSCDVNTGQCHDCKHNTIGDHCESCTAGYHGDATQGTPYDCLICACPLPIETNNFANSCEVSPSGLEISCSCKNGYIGPRCSACAAGFFGRPEVPGSSCKPCDCSGNIDQSHPGSCDSVSGACVLCLNNTFGAACELCAPGFYGDAVGRKNCARCDCNECGTERCDHLNGECLCWPNVEGHGCSQCALNHWGFHSCTGCRKCNCGPASLSDQCDIDTGKCSCQPGAGGHTCDVCEPGYWKYSENGCLSCNCDEKYSAGAVCDPVTGYCECLPGVIGEKCDSCPYRWVFIPNQGCLECGPCVHALIDETDSLGGMIEPVMEEMQDISASYFANKRLQNVNRTVDTLKIAVDELILDPSDLGVSPLVYDVQNLEKDKDSIEKTSIHSFNQAIDVAKEAEEARKSSLEVEKNLYFTINDAREIVIELKKLSEGLAISSGPNHDYLMAEAEYILQEITERDFDYLRNSSVSELEESDELLEQVKTFELPVSENQELLKKQNNKLAKLGSLIEELNNNSQTAYGTAENAESIEWRSRGIPLNDEIDEVNNLSMHASTILDNATELLEEALGFEEESGVSYEVLTRDADRLQLAIRNLKDHIIDSNDTLKETLPVSEQAKKHANHLKEQATLLDHLLADTRDSSDAAVQAANAYSHIVDAINNALIAAQSALGASNEAGDISNGVSERAEESRERSVELLDEAIELQNQVEELDPQLNAAKEDVLFIAQQNRKTAKAIDIIDKELDKLPFRSLSVVAGDAAEGSALADNVAKQAKGKIEKIVDRLPNDILEAQNVPSGLDDTKQAMKAAHNYVDRISSIIPDTSDLMDLAIKKESVLKIVGVDVSDKIEKVKQKVALARNQANWIKLGVQFYENTTLQVRNPERIQRAATYTQMSMYFKTQEKYGLLAYVGNEKGAHSLMKRVRTDDYMALEIRGGTIVLTMDLGSGAQEIKHNTYVSDGKWHQVIFERTGKACTLTVRTDGEADAMVEGFLPGIHTVFNLDQQVSKIFVGGIPNEAKIQETVKNFRFDGCIEEVKLGKVPIGLWDFVHAENNFEGCAERDQLVIAEPTNDFRFSGTGYVILPRKKMNFATETFIKMKFKTYASEGLLFLIGKKNDDFLALQLVNGKIVLAYELGSGMAEITSDTVYNDGEWHSLEATRDGVEAVLKVDNIEVGSSQSPGSQKTLSSTNQIFVGGHPGLHSYEAVTQMAFEGCIKGMQIGAEVTDLNKNKEVLGVISGCPVTIARVISFTNDSTGYVAMPFANLKKQAQLTFKFKTAEENGLLFYAANDDQSSFLSISLSNGVLVMNSKPGGKIKTSPDHKYNDMEWHYVSAFKTIRQMRLDIDDIDSVEAELPSEALVEITTPLYFGGVPEKYIINTDAVPFYKPLVGCLGDTTVNNKFQNFADSKDRQVASLASCPLADTEQETIEPLVPVTVPSTGVVEVTDDTTEGIEEEEEDMTTTDISIPEPTPVGKCALPLHPRPEKIKPREGIRFGNTPHSRLELMKPNSFMNTIVDNSTFSLEFRTSMNDGLLFYVDDNKHIDFIGLLMMEGKVIYVFNCGTGSAVISSQYLYNDGEWHKATFFRQRNEGKLSIDEKEEISGISHGSATSVNVHAPFYVGGLSEDLARQSKNNLKGIVSSFPGCIRNVEAQGESLNMKKLSSSFNVTGCSDKVEEGAFVSGDGGHIILYDKYKVGTKRQMTLDIKPRSLSGVLVAIHGNKDYLLLQLIDGRVSFSVDNGRGAITTTFDPPYDHYLCDGEWHTIAVAKVNNVVTLSVDGESADPGIGITSVSSTDTDDPLHVGGVPNPYDTKGLVTYEQFSGCIRYLMIDGVVQNFAQSRVFGNVRLNTCPTV